MGPSLTTGNKLVSIIHSALNQTEATRILITDFKIAKKNKKLPSFYSVVLWLYLAHIIDSCMLLSVINHYYFLFIWKQPVAKRMGLDTRTNSSFWKDRAVVELNTAVQYSFQVGHFLLILKWVKEENQRQLLDISIAHNWNWWWKSCSRMGYGCV